MSSKENSPISCRLRQQLTFMLNRTEITQTRMQTLAIVKPIKIVIQAISYTTPANLLVCHGQLALDRCKHRFRRRIVITVADAAHRTRNAMTLAPRPIPLASVLTATVEMMDYTTGLTKTGCLVQGVSHQLSIMAARETAP